MGRQTVATDWEKIDETRSGDKIINITLQSQDGRYKVVVFWDAGFILRDRQSESLGCIGVDHIANLTCYLEALEEEAVRHFGAEWAE